MVNYVFPSVGGEVKLQRTCPHCGRHGDRIHSAMRRRAKALHEQAPAMRVRVLGVDGTGAKLAGEHGGMVFFVDVDRQWLVCVEAVRATDTKKVREHTQRVMEHVGADEMRTDEWSVYERTTVSKHTMYLATGSRASADGPGSWPTW